MTKVIMALALLVTFTAHANESETSYKLIKGSKRCLEGIIVKENAYWIDTSYEIFHKSMIGCKKTSPGSTAPSVKECTSITKNEVSRYNVEVGALGYVKIGYWMKLNAAGDILTYQRKTTSIPLGILPVDTGDFKCTYKRI